MRKKNGYSGITLYLCDMMTKRYLTIAIIICCHWLTTSAVVVADSIPELPLPNVPTTLRTPTDRANYIIQHFWDAMAFGDTIQSHNRMFMEQNFSNFISLFPYAEEEARQRAVGKLLQQAEADSAGYVLLRDIAEKYLYEPNSPMLSEEFYILFLERLVKSPILGEYGQQRAYRQLDAARKNRPGMTAADFAYTTREGNKTTLHKTDSQGDLLLMFYDPDCEHCKEVMGDLQANKAFCDVVASGNIKVLAIYSDDNEELWKQTASSLPANWTVGYDGGMLQEKGSYVLRAMPTLYLLDHNKKVILKDVLPAHLLLMLRNNK